MHPLSLCGWLGCYERKQKDMAISKIISCDLQLEDTENDSGHLKRHHQASMRRFWIL